MLSSRYTAVTMMWPIGGVRGGSTSPVDLVLVQLGDELQVYLSGLARGGPLTIIGMTGLIESLPGAELLALWRPYDQVGALLADELPGADSLTADVEVPR